MKSYRLIHQLLHLVEKLESETPDRELTLQDFAGFLVSEHAVQTGAPANSDMRFGSEEPVAQDIAFQLDNNIGRLVVYMSRYAKFYIKKALEGTPLQTAEDFTCLAILLTHPNLSKKELISYNLQEKTSGTEVIRRLISAGLVNQADDENDKRGKRISITNEGRELLYRVFVDMSYVGRIVTGDLSEEEKLTLNYLLQRLENFHHHVYAGKLVQTKADIAAVVEEQSKK
ncbi:winged helix DNA-binding protein [Mucilaginibacter sp. ZT4R22]|uniref:Winged helix DNA-binding protein n=1 Tax=Mucilaginibacter pankratovii TaxID=2772110 RepID=A0ABR7WS20_9SPHI|nr:winged helix DNA-binding protein [Mucilaginibacter pankratovii]MBD1365100.1 winged helix DNA-binding protein [Mucilaginibacter pankratovii]